MPTSSQTNFKYICSVDVGIQHLGVSFSKVTNDYEFIQTEQCFLVNLMEMEHKRVKRCDCKLYHEKTASDRIDHFVQDYGPFIDQCDTLLIELQPPMGLKDIEQLLFKAFRSKAILVSPNSMHAHFGLPSGDYDLRKDLVTSIGKTYLSPQALAEVEQLERQHDIMDSICHCVCWAAKKHDEIMQQRQQEEQLRKKEEAKKKLEEINRLRQQQIYLDRAEHEKRFPSVHYNPFAKYKYQGAVQKQ